MPNESLKKDKARFGNRPVITGGWDRQSKAAVPGTAGDEVRGSVYEALDTWGADGAQIFWDGGIAGTGEDSMSKKRWLYDEFQKYAGELYRK